MKGIQQRTKVDPGDELSSPGKFTLKRRQRRKNNWSEGKGKGGEIPSSHHQSSCVGKSPRGIKIPRKVCVRLGGE